MNREKMLRFVDNIAVASFMTMAFFIPTSNSVVEICFGVILSCFILRVIFERPRWNDVLIFFTNRINLSLLIFFVFIGISLFASGDLLGKSAYAWTCKWGERIFLFYFAQLFLKKRHVRIILVIFCVTAFISTLSGFWQRITGQDFLRGFEAISTGGFIAIRSTFNHSNDFAVFLAAMFFIVYGFVQQEREKIVRVALSGLCCMLIVSLWLTYSRGGWLAFIVAFLLLIFLSDRKSKIVVFIFMLFMVGGLLSLPIARERILSTFQPGGDMSRGALWTGAFLMFRSSPVFGTGVGLFMDRLPEYSAHSGQYAHNSYLQMLAEIGILGFGAFLWFLWELIFRAYKAFTRERDTLLTGMCLGLIVFLVHSFFDTHFYSLRLSMFFWMIAGMISIYLKELQWKTQKDLILA